MAIDNKDKKVLKSSIEREQNELACSAEREKIKGSKNLNVPHLRFPEFSGEWEEHTLSEYLEFKNGLNPGAKRIGSGLPFISVMDILSEGVINYDNIRGKVNATEKEIECFGVKDGDLLFQRSSETLEDVGRANVYMDNRTAIYGGFVIRGRKIGNYDPLFFKYLLATPLARKRTCRMGAGAQHFNIGQEGLSKISLYFPSIEEQRKIAEFLSLIDERIATQNKIIDKLKSLIKGIDEVVFQSCSKHCKLKEFDNQITAGRDKVEEGCFPLYGSTGVIGTTATPSYHEPLVLVARVGSIGCVQFVNIPCGVSDNTIVIRCGSKAKYVYYYLQNYNFERITSGTTQPLITAKDVKHIDIPIIDSANDLKAINTLDTLNMKLELESNLYNTILKQKAFLLQQMFI